VNFIEGRKFAIQQQGTTENVAEYFYWAGINATYCCSLQHLMLA
jgi:hypothetical protein